MITATKNQVFLGGTCGNNNWREDFINDLVNMGVKAEKLFNPVVSNWDEEAQRKEDLAKEESKYMLFYIANPKTEGNETSGYSLIELTMGLYDQPETTVGVLDTSELSPSVAKALTKGFNDLKKRFPEAKIFNTKEEALKFFAEIL